MQKGNSLGDMEGIPYREYGVPPIRKELPMEFTASVTAVMAIVSFGFLAAMLLGMI